MSVESSPASQVPGTGVEEKVPGIFVLRDGRGTSL